MANVFNLLESAEAFCKKALWSYFWTRAVVKYGAEDLLSEADNYDFKDEELSNLFQAFMNGYKEFIDSLKFNPANLTEEAMADAGDLLGTLNKRYERLMEIPYLNMSPEEGYEEDFDPGDFSAFIQRVVNDASQRLNKLAGEDIDIGDLRAGQIAREFNSIQEKAEEGKKEEWSARKVEQALEAHRNWARNLQFIRKVGPSHPDYQRYQKYIETRRRNYQYIMEDPARKEAYRGKAKERQSKWRKALLVKKQELETLLKKTTDPKKRATLEAELAAVQQGLEKREKAEETRAQKVRQLKESGTLTAKIVHLQQKLATLKKDTAKLVKDKAASDPYFTPFKQAVKAAKDTLDQQASPANQELLEDAVRKEAEAIKNYLDKNPAVIKVKEDLVQLYSFRDKLKTLAEAGWTNEGPLPEEAKMLVRQLVIEGEKLVVAYGRVYRGIASTMLEITTMLKTKL